MPHPGTKFARDAWLRALERTASIERNPEVTLPVLIERWGRERGRAPALESAAAVLSYADLAARANRYARFGLSQGLKQGDVVALLMGNCAEYLAVWLGLTRIGAIVALVNTHLADEPLAHSIRAVSPKLIIVGAAHGAAFGGVRGRVPDIACWVSGADAQHAHSDAVDAVEAAGVPRLEPPLGELAGEPLDVALCALPSLDSTALYIYTSGTTGLPKAARVSHYRLMQWSQWFAGLMDTGPHDRMYDCLPLYHSIGGVVATGATLTGGGTVVIRGGFSATDFWRDVREQRCTLFQYIGELCRYLVNAPRRDAETSHGLRLACGNGLRRDVWEIFESRFRIPRIIEYYASTEGNFSLYNCEGEPGAIGRIPAFLAHRLPVALIRIDAASGDPERGAGGLCEACAVDESGEAIAMLPAAEAIRTGRFEGYAADSRASADKVLRNVFRADDAWYRSGDLMRRDARGFFYFLDRIGDTFRWKGENVSTAEVLSALTRSRGVLDGVVYGVAVPGAEGRAGMAALLVGEAFDLDVMYADAARRLPAYARPLFLRLLPRLEATGTFKPMKRELVESGFDPGRMNDPLYFDCREAGSYVPLDAALYAAICNGGVRL